MNLFLSNGCREHQDLADLRSSLNLGRLGVEGQVEVQAVWQKLDAALQSPVAVAERPEHGEGITAVRRA